jgi:hypothetical protein
MDAQASTVVTCGKLCKSFRQFDRIDPMIAVSKVEKGAFFPPYKKGSANFESIEGIHEIHTNIYISNSCKVHFIGGGMCKWTRINW